MLLYIYGAVTLLCLLAFRSWRGVVCIILPLGLVSILSYALMSLLGIGLKTSTLPVAALGVGIGVDYGIYIFSRLRELLDEGLDLRSAYKGTLESAGNAVLVTGLTLAIGVSTWIFSDLQFQADMGVLLTFMFLANMLGAILLLPALAAFLLPGAHTPGGERSPD
jgi:predicted RND superfamily exporter protein